MSDRQAAVVIPLYRERLTDLEEISLTQAFRILNAYDICFVMPESLHIGDIIGKMADGAGGSWRIREERFRDGYFDGVSAYNRLMLTEEFYRRFSGYEYILIYQLDAFVFSDKLRMFCGLGYDYIGAPWIDGSFYYKDREAKVWYVGNGGLSLRRVESFIEVLERHRDMLPYNKIPEDQFFSMMEGGSFHIAPVETALEFSFEMNVERCYGMNGGRLPFGCHAWHRFNLPFWKPRIEGYGYRIPEEACRGGREDDSFLVHTRRKEITRFWLREYQPEEFKRRLLALFSRQEGECAVWGAGYWGQVLCRMLEDAGLQVRTFLDGRKPLECRQVLGHEVAAPETLGGMAEKYRIVVAVTCGYEEIGDILDRMDYGYRRDYIYLKDIDLLYQNVLI